LNLERMNLLLALAVAFTTACVYAGGAKIGEPIQITRDIGDEHCWNASRLVFNADSTRLFVVRPSGKDPNEVGSRPAIYDIRTGEMRWCSDFGFNVHWGMVWDRHNPDVIYGVAGTKVLSLNVATGKIGEIIDFAPHASFDLDAIYHPSLNEAGDRIAVQGRAKDGSWRAVFTAKLNGTDVHEIPYEKPPTRKSGHCMFTRTDSYLSIGDFRGHARDVIVNYDGSGVVDVPDCGGHAAFSPTGYLVYSKPYDFEQPGYIMMLPLLRPDEKPKPVLPWSFSHPTPKGRMPISKFQNHISWNHDDPTWFIMDAYTQQNKLREGWSRIRVIYRIYVSGRKPPELLYECPEPLLWYPEKGPWIHYWAQGLASTSRDGKWLVFSSSKDHPKQGTGVNVYLLRIE